MQSVGIFAQYSFGGFEEFYSQVVCIHCNKVQWHIPDTVVNVSKWDWQLEQKEPTTPWEIFLEFLENSETWSLWAGANFAGDLG